MRIAYIAAIQYATGSGPLKKILGQVQAWREMGHDARVFLINRAGPVWEGLRNAQVEIIGYPRMRDIFRAYHQLADAVNAWKPEIVYLRYGMFVPGLLRILKQLPTVLEIQSDELTELKVGQYWRRYWYFRLTRGQVLRHARAFVFVSQELSRLPSFASYRKPATVIANGIDLASFPILPPVVNTQLVLAFLGYTQYFWSGVDKIVEMARLFPYWRFELIGPEAADFTGTFPSNIHLHGHLEREAYAPILAGADVAIGPLALYRKQMSEMSALKMREYLAFGLPVIYAGEDTDFPGEYPFLLRLPNVEDNIGPNVEAIRSFVEHVKGTRVPREAIAHLDVAVKERRRLDFFAEILAS